MSASSRHDPSLHSRHPGRLPSRRHLLIRLCLCLRLCTSLCRLLINHYSILGTANPRCTHIPPQLIVERLDRLGRRNLPVRLDLIDDLLDSRLAKLRRRRRTLLLLHLRSAHLWAARAARARDTEMRLRDGRYAAHGRSRCSDLSLRRAGVRPHRRVHHRWRSVHPVHAPIGQLAHRMGVWRRRKLRRLRMGRSSRSSRCRSVLALLRLRRLPRRGLLGLQHLDLLLHLRVVSLCSSRGSHVGQRSIDVDGRAIRGRASGLSSSVGGCRGSEELLLAGRHVWHGLAIGGNSGRTLRRLADLAGRSHLRLLRSGRKLLSRLRHRSTLRCGLLLLLLRHHLLLLPYDLLPRLVHLLQARLTFSRFPHIPLKLCLDELERRSDRAAQVDHVRFVDVNHFLGLFLHRCKSAIHAL